MIWFARSLCEMGSTYGWQIEAVNRLELVVTQDTIMVGHFRNEEFPRGHYMLITGGHGSVFCCINWRRRVEHVALEELLKLNISKTWIVRKGVK